MAHEYNGHPSYNHWNVALWFGNDEGLYRMAREEIRRAKNRDQAARAILDSLRDSGVTETPDGVRYTRTNIRHALRGL